jgi:hypothetical protein
MGRLSRGWTLTKESWAVVRGDRSLLVFPVVAGVCALVVAAILFGAAAGIGTSTNSYWAAAPFVVVGVYALIAIAQFFAVALTACAEQALQGRDTTFSEGVTAARGRLGVILGWAFVQLLVGALISGLQMLLREGAGNLVGSIVGGLANFAWTVATFFVVPVIALEGLGPKAALQRSIGVIRQRWGEGVTGTFAIGGLVFLFAFLPGAALVAGGIALAGVGGDVLIAIGVIVFVTGAVVQSALMAVFKVALYRFAAEDRVTGPFERTQLETAFAPRGRARAATI